MQCKTLTVCHSLGTASRNVGVVRGYCAVRDLTEVSFDLHSFKVTITMSCRQEALLAAISEKDANIALLELSSSKKKKTHEEVAQLRREKDRLVQQLKQQVLTVL